MSLRLSQSLPQVVVKTGLPVALGFVSIGDYQISMQDFILMVHYVMTNTDLEDGDPRRMLTAYVEQAVEVPGYNSGHTRFDIPGGVF